MKNSCCRQISAASLIFKCPHHEQMIERSVTPTILILEKEEISNLCFRSLWEWMNWNQSQPLKYDYKFYALCDLGSTIKSQGSEQNQGPLNHWSLFTILSKSYPSPFFLGKQTQAYWKEPTESGNDFYSKTSDSGQFYWLWGLTQTIHYQLLQCLCQCLNRKERRFLDITKGIRESEQRSVRKQRDPYIDSSVWKRRNLIIIVLQNPSTQKMSFYIFSAVSRQQIYYITPFLVPAQYPFPTYISNISTPIQYQRIPQSIETRPSPEQTHPSIQRQSEENQNPPRNSPTIQKPPPQKRKLCPQKERQSGRKNSQSNIVNQFLALMNNQQFSQKLVEKAIRVLNKGGQRDIEKIKTIFYNIIRFLNLKRGRKYVNRNTLLKFYTPMSFQKQFPEIQSKCLDTGVISLEEICRLFRIVSYHFIRNYSTPAVLTSKRVSMLVKGDHLERKRKLQNSLAADSME